MPYQINFTSYLAMMKIRICGCVQGYSLNATDNICYPNPTWCESAADCADNEVCCSYVQCDGSSVQKCMESRETCLTHPGCASRGVIVGEERMQADEAKKNETSSSEERSEEKERNQQRRRPKKKGRNN